MTIVVVGVGADGPDGLSPSATAEIAACDVLIGARRQLDLLPEGDFRKVLWPSPLLPALDSVLAEHEGRRIVVLASGDPLHHGIGTTLVNRLGADRVRIVPALSSSTLARARLGWSAEETAVVSAVARSPYRVLAAVGDGRKVLVLSGDASTPATIAGLLTEAGFGASTLTVLEELGGPSERQVSGTAAGWNEPEGAALNVVAIDCAGDHPLRLLAGLPDNAFEHDGQLTKRDVRASALARLSPSPGELLWDVGAGAGSVAIEWARAHPANRAIAVEADETRAARIQRNARRLGVPDVRAVTGRAPEALTGLGTPDAVFVGGGVGTPGLLARCHAALPRAGRLVANAVTLEAEQALLAAYAEFGGELIRLSVEHAAPLGGLTGWKPARTITQWSIST
ncbi:precorrin-6Y C5,15-methyltransferase (decarboxylating) [Prauserella marina]|uniref:Precorrin-6Y C5,15-methyltransferase (Decarboxylating) n=1 Tax=Prauserella marina TaxID=530584 RepID=A0A1G6LUT6_9PSEU|nr:precorrin-6y C5,15-methyltransferase (decarboxylating) subunit CbiE [Prauserella marina]PWV85735.1 precorrin-6Y C5,15-methyltransferase (decarboxylating) [Prauserella marina]SDC46969.1 precorrin-6Y C5,15-methyltransferase (decarboxylating) [Prauserella marina]